MSLRTVKNILLATIGLAVFSLCTPKAYAETKTVDDTYTRLHLLPVHLNGNEQFGALGVATLRPYNFAVMCGKWIALPYNLGFAMFAVLGRPLPFDEVLQTNETMLALGVGMATFIKTFEKFERPRLMLSEDGDQRLEDRPELNPEDTRLRPILREATRGRVLYDGNREPVLVERFHLEGSHDEDSRSFVVSSGTAQVVNVRDRSIVRNLELSELSCGGVLRNLLAHRRQK